MNKILIVLSGESFRDGGTGVRSTGNSLNNNNQQILAIKSQIRLIEKIENQYNIKCDVFLNTYGSNGLENEIISLYDKRLAGFNIHHTKLSGEFEMIEDTLMRINELENFRLYKNVLFIRADLYIKKEFIDIFRLDDNKVIYSFVDSNPSFNLLCVSMNMEICKNYSPINHLIALVPNKFFDLLIDKKVWYWHYSASRLIGEMGDEDVSNYIDFYTDSVHWCNSSIEWNPFFVQAGRPNSNIYIQCGELKFDILPHEFVIASRGIRFDTKLDEKYLINDDKLYDDLRSSEVANDTDLEFFY